MKTISPKQLQEKHAAGEALALIDVRTPGEFRAMRVPFAVNLPLNTISAAAVRSTAQDAPVYVICRSGQRAQAACTQLAREGCKGLTLVEGGTLAWAAAGLETARDTAAFSVERQIRIIAGVAVLAGTALGYTVDPDYLAIPAACGFWLAYTGLTDCCAMNLLLSRMPWSRGNGGGGCCGTGSPLP